MTKPIALKDLERRFMLDTRSIRLQAQRSDRRQVLKAANVQDVCAAVAVGVALIGLDAIAAVLAYMHL